MGLLSLEFCAFFIVLFCIYWGCKKSVPVQNAVLLIAGYLFLASMHVYFAIMLAAFTLVIYGCAAYIRRYRDAGSAGLVVAVTIAVGILAVFKYYDFFVPPINDVLAWSGFDVLIPMAQIMVPLGISFYTFNAITYLVALQHKEMEPVGLCDLALFLSFFPSVTAGPINRATVFMPQLQQERVLTDMPRAGLLVVFGLIKVIWLSAFLANTWVNPVFENPSQYHSLDVLLGIFAYTWQIYLNFSGYTDLVTGLALMLGFQLPLNFNAPYLARNLGEFWERWHISLSTWIRDYLYIPLGGSRKGFGRTQCNVMIAFILSGLWHGSSLNFLIWGAVHGIGLVALHVMGRQWGKGLLSKRLPHLSMMCTIIYVSFAWVFFRAETFDLSKDIFAALWSNRDTYLQFNAPLYLLLMYMAFRYYATLVRCRAYLFEQITRMQWYVQPVFIVALLWIGMALSPSGIPGFIYASF